MYSIFLVLDKLLKSYFLVKMEKEQKGLFVTGWKGNHSNVKKEKGGVVRLEWDYNDATGGKTEILIDVVKNELKRYS
ncbi:MAG: hypothetical protein ACTSW1_11360 [Candidatus Hodarchaeales archaeon]